MKNIKVLVLVITLVYSFFFGNLDFLSFSDFAVYLNFNAICVYSNADTQKKQILTENKGKAGVYRWTNQESGNAYIGSSADLYRRFKEYFSLGYLEKYQKSSAICNALLSKGYSNFSLEILEYCEKVKTEILKKEQDYIDLLKPEYNILKKAGSCLGRKHTDETKILLRDANLGRKHTEETKAKIKAAATALSVNRKGKPHTEESIEKILNTLLGRKHSEATLAKLRALKHTEDTKTKIGVALGTAIEVTDLETGITIEFISMGQAAKELNVSASSIRKYLLSQKSYKNRYLIKNKSNSVIKTEDGGNNTKEDEHLSGSFANSKLLKQYKESLGKLSQVQWEAAVGLMLGDSSLQTQNSGKTFRMKFEWGNKSKFYIDHVFNLFDEWVLSEPHKKIRLSPAGNKVINWGFQTISHEAFNDLAKLFLNQRTKSISTDLIKNHLTPRGLAYWFMDDGGKLDYNKNSKNKSVVLNTQSFKDKEVEIMTQQIMEKFNLDCEVRSNKGKKVIVIKSSSYSAFLLLIDPYILTEMRYKLP